MTGVTMEKIVSLCKRRGFVFPGSEIYGGLANSWDYGPMGVELKKNIKDLWWSKFVHRRDDMVGIDAALIMNPKVWEASTHLKNFSDPLVECRNCHGRFRADQIGFPDLKQGEMSEAFNPPKCPNCGSRDQWTAPKQFNLMLRTFLGPIDSSDVYLKYARLGYLQREEIELNNRHATQEELKGIVQEIENIKKEIASMSDFYFRPETAQAIFVDFKNVLETSRKKLPFGVAQIGKAFRNEITPGNFIFRTREFEQMEIEYFIQEENWKEAFELWRKEMNDWMENDLGLDMSHVHELEVLPEDLAHYSKRTIDFEYDYPFGRKELYGLAYRTDFDLKNHFKEAPYRDQETNESFYPHVIEPSLGVDRTVLAVLLDAYNEEGEGDKKRVYLKLKPKLAPYKAAVFPLLANKPDLIAKAKEVYASLKKDYAIAWDDRGNIGKRYFAQDEIGTPFCITVDFDTIGQGDDASLVGTVTVRNRDTGTQERVSIENLRSVIASSLE